MNSSTIRKQTVRAQTTQQEAKVQLAHTHRSSKQPQHTVRPRGRKYRTPTNCYATLKNPIHRLTGHDSSTPTDTTPKSSGVAPRVTLQLARSHPFGSRDPEPDGYSPRSARSAISDSKIGRSTEQASRAPQGKTPADHRLRNDQLWHTVQYGTPNECDPASR